MFRIIARDAPRWTRQRRRSRAHAEPGRAARSRWREAWCAGLLSLSRVDSAARIRNVGDGVDLINANASLQRMLSVCEPVPSVNKGIDAIGGGGWFLRGTFARRSAAMKRSRVGVFAKVIGNVLV